MRIVLTSWETPPVRGGIATFVGAFAPALAARGHDVTLVSVAREGAPAGVVRRDDGVREVRLEPASVSAAGEPFATLHAWTAHAALLDALLRSARDLFDACECPDYRGEAAAYLSAPVADRRPALIRVHTPLAVIEAHNRARAGEGVLREFELSALRRAGALVFPSTAMRDELLRRAPELQQCDWVLHPHAVDPWWLSDEATEAARGETRAHEVLFVGRLEERKGVLVLAEAMRRVLENDPRVTLRLVGDDTPLREGESGREAMLRVLGPAVAGRVMFDGGRGREHVARALGRARVVCFPSLFENFPNVCLEAMCARASIVGTRGTGMQDMLEEGVSGRLVPPGDPYALADAIRSALSDSDDTRRALGEAAHARVRERYTPGACAQAYEDVLCRVGVEQAPASGFAADAELRAMDEAWRAALERTVAGAWPLRAREQVALLSAERDEARARHEESEAELREARAYAQQLEARAGDALREAGAFRDEARAWRDEAQRLEQEWRDASRSAEDARAGLRVALEDTQRRVDDLARSLESARTLAETYRAEAQEKSVMLMQLDARVLRADAEVQSLAQRDQVISATAAMLSDDCRRLSRQLEALRARVRDVEAQPLLRIARRLGVVRGVEQAAPGAGQQRGVSAGSARAGEA